jgi:hypothetical protein
MSIDNYIEEDDFFGADSLENEEVVPEEEVEVEQVEDGSLDDYFFDDIDFSEFSGKNFKSSLRKVNKAIDKRETKRKAPKKVQFAKTKPAPIGRKKVTNIPVKKKAVLNARATQYGGEAKTTKRVIVPSDRKVIIEGVDKFILSKSSQDDSIKNVGYHKGKKLKELILTLDNSGSAIDFNLELFNPSMPLDYLYSTSGNLNNKITTAGQDVSYSDVLFNILGNPTRIHNAKFVFSGASTTAQINQALIIKQKGINGYEKIDPVQLALQLDRYQFASNIVFFNIDDALGRPFIPNGMDVIQYKVLAGNICTFCFFYEQVDLRKVFYKDAARSKELL